MSGGWSNIPLGETGVCVNCTHTSSSGPRVLVWVSLRPRLEVEGGLDGL